MIIKEITVSGGRTINIGDYNSVKVEGSCTIEVEDVDTGEDVRAAAIQEVKIQLREAYDALKPPARK